MGRWDYQQMLTQGCDGTVRLDHLPSARNAFASSIVLSMVLILGAGIGANLESGWKLAEGLCHRQGVDHWLGGTTTKSVGQQSAGLVEPGAGPCERATWERTHLTVGS